MVALPSYEYLILGEFSHIITQKMVPSGFDHSGTSSLSLVIINTSSVRVCRMHNGRTEFFTLQGPAHTTPLPLAIQPTGSSYFIKLKAFLVCSSHLAMGIGSSDISYLCHFSCANVSLQLDSKLIKSWGTITFSPLTKYLEMQKLMNGF